MLEIYIYWYREWSAFRKEIRCNIYVVCIAFGEGVNALWILPEISLSFIGFGGSCTTQIPDNERQLWLEIGIEPGAGQNPFEDVQDIRVFIK